MLGKQANRTRICIAQPFTNLVSETFIRAHAERLPAETRVVALHDGPVPLLDGEPLLRESTITMAKGVRKVFPGLTGHDGAWELSRALGKVFPGVEAVLAEYGPTGVKVLPAARKANVPLIVHFHGFDASRREVLEQQAEGYRAIFREAAAIVAVSKPMRERLIGLGAPPEKVYLSPYGVDLEAFSSERRQDTGPVFLGVGRFVEKKAPYLTLAAFAQVHARWPEARLRMIGDGPLLGVCQDLTRGLEIENAVDFLGPQPHGVVADEMAKARCFVQHSIEDSAGDCEGAPVAILEACATGLPVVSTRHAGIPEIVIDGETGYLVEERDVKGMADRMLRILEAPERAADMGRAGRQRIESHYTWEQSIERLWRIIHGAIRGDLPAPDQVDIQTSC